MNISNDAKKISSILIHKFNKKYFKRTALQQKKNDAIIKTLYNDIRLSYIHINLLMKGNNLEKQIIEIKSIGDIPQTDLLDSRFVPDNVKREIYKARGCIIFKTKIYETEIKLYFLLMGNNSFDMLDEYNDYIKNTLAWLKMALLYCSDKKRKLKIFFYLTSITKKIPTTPIQILGCNNCNSAVTTACNTDGEILIFRKEEWFKVLIHETMHVLCLDFSGLSYSKLKKQINSIFNINSEFLISESYSEFWATIINCLFHSYNLLDDVCDFDGFSLYAEFFICFEKIFSLLQMVKILDYMGLTYPMLYQKQIINLSFKEDTNVFAYYIIKSILLFFFEDFLSWCEKNNTEIIRFNKTPQNLNKFFKFIQSKYKHKELLYTLKSNDGIHNLYKQLNQNPKNTIILNTMRMSLWDIQ